ncbi:MAG: lipid-binding SYLF domain-containing protein [Phycisphaerae bacterium]|nr:lipid-binding SYLF domain-containing protein [Phycisphaerae bacterium]
MQHVLRSIRKAASIALFAVASFTLGACNSDNEYQTEAVTSPALESNARQATTNFKQTDPGLQRFFDNAAGYAIFPEVTKGGFVIGASRGDGVLYERGSPTHYVTMTAGTIGAQIGGQVFSEIIFFKTVAELDHFKQGHFEMDANASAVAVRSGASVAADYVNGVAVFVTGERGLMAEASVGGQKFKVRRIQ